MPRTFAGSSHHFLEIGSGTELARELAKRGVRTSRGNRIDKKYLYRLLNNRALIGEAVHKGDSYPGEHDAIIVARRGTASTPSCRRARASAPRAPAPTRPRC